MYSKIDTIIFDIGGVLIPNYNDYIKKDISLSLGINLTDIEKAWNELIPNYLGRGKITETEFWIKFKQITKCQTDVNVESLLIRAIDNRYAPFAIVSDIVKNLSLNGYKLGLISDTIQSHVDCLTQHGLFDRFSVKVFSSETGFRKPESEIFQIALNQLKSIPKNTIFIDDNPDNVLAAEKLGFIGIIFKNDNQLKTDLENLGVNINIVPDKKPKERGAYALILTTDKKVILQQRNVNSNVKNSGKLAMFGGALENGEDLLAGLKRELLEELELNINDYKIEKLNTYAKTESLDGIDHLANVWLIYDVDIDTLRIHEGESFFLSNPGEIIDNPRLTRVTNLALHDLINKLS